MTISKVRIQAMRIAIGVMIAISTVAAILLTLNAKAFKDRFEVETFSILYEFILLVVLGGGLSLVYKSVERNREVLKEMRAMHADILEAYNRTKTVRRELRAALKTRKSIAEDTRITEQLYVSKMLELNKSQLSYEVHAMWAESDLFFYGDKDALAKLMRASEKYLNSILKEYQDSLALFEGAPPSQLLRDLPVLAEFIGPHSKDGNFEMKLASTNEKLLETLTRVLLK